MKIEKILPLEKASNMEFQREREVTQQWLSEGMKINIYISELFCDWLIPKLITI